MSEKNPCQCGRRYIEHGKRACSLCTEEICGVLVEERDAARLRSYKADTEATDALLASCASELRASKLEAEINAFLVRLQEAHDTIASIETGQKPLCTGCSRTHAFIRSRHPGLFCPDCGRPDWRGHMSTCKHQPAGDP